MGRVWVCLVARVGFYFRNLPFRFSAPSPNAVTAVCTPYHSSRTDAARQQISLLVLHQHNSTLFSCTLNSVVALYGTLRVRSALSRPERGGLAGAMIRSVAGIWPARQLPQLESRDDG